MAAPVSGLPEKRYLIPGVVVFGAALFAYFVGVLPAQSDAGGDLAALQTKHQAVKAALGQKGGPVTQGHVKAAEQRRSALEAEHAKCGQFFKDVDAAYEQFFPKYEGRADLPNPPSFKTAYLEAARALAAQAEKVAGRDGNGQKLAPFVFKRWPGQPDNLEILMTQKEYWMQRAMLAAVKATGTDVKLRMVRVGMPNDINAALAARLPGLGVEARQGQRWTRWQWTEVRIEVDLRGSLVGTFLAQVMAPEFQAAPSRRLITELRDVHVSSAATMAESIPVDFEPAKDKDPRQIIRDLKVDVDAMEPRVRVTVNLAVLDPPTIGGAS